MDGLSVADPPSAAPPKGQTLSAPHMLFVPSPRTPALGTIAVYDAGDDVAAVTAAAAQLGLHGGAVGNVRVALPREGKVVVRELHCVRFGLDAALPALLRVPPPLPGAPAEPAHRRRPETVRAWSLAARLCLRAVAAEQLVPTLREHDGGLVAHWRVGDAGDGEQHAAMARLAAAMPRAAHALALDDERVWDAAGLLAAFADAVADHAVRAGGAPPSPGRPRERLLPWTARWAEALADPEDPRVPLRDDPGELLAGLRTWERGTAGDPGAGALHLRLLPAETADDPWRVRVGHLDAGGVLRTAEEIWGGTAAPSDEAALLQERLLHALGAAIRVFAALDRVLEAAVPAEALLDRDEAWAFLSEAVPALVAAGVAVEVPDELAEDALALRLVVGGDESGDAPQLDEDELGADEPSALEGWDEALRADEEAVYRWEVSLGGTLLDRAALDELARQGGPLVRWDERWVRVDPLRLRRLAELEPDGSMPLAEALALALAGSREEPFSDDGEPVGEAEVSARGALGRLVDRIRSAVELPPAPASPEGFTGELRPYQQRGVAWLQGMAGLGLGAVLADDMGLGKTVQLIAHLLTLPPGRRRWERFLIVCPTSVVGNWERELNRFAPGLPVVRFHGPERPHDLAAVEGVVLTTYGMLRREPTVLQAVRWDCVAVDEAQHVKNPRTAGARAVRGLSAGQRVALTGTPLENRLADLWAIMDATNPGLLGSPTVFSRRFATPIERRGDGGAARRLRRLVAPFVLRREKRDPTVVTDLPDKIERTVACTLTSEQAELYEAAVASAFAGDGTSVLEAKGIARHGRVLALLTALKQICNHPEQYRAGAAGGGDGVTAADASLVGRSGKLAAAREIVHEAVEVGDKVLVFTQFTAMGRLLVRQFSADLGVAVPFLHGGVPGAARDRMVAAFQGEAPDGEDVPVLVVSLRAGGTGLNLTAATHVLHYDRWWNPAVEDQATDRAHRIGQLRTVEVHKLVTAGTLEERIAEHLERKRALADAVVGAGESWIADLGDTELRELVALSRDAGHAELDDDELDGDELDGDELDGGELGEPVGDGGPVAAGVEVSR